MGQVKDITYEATYREPVKNHLIPYFKNKYIHEDCAKIFLCNLLAACGELGNGSGGRGLGGLSAGVGIDLGIENQQVDIPVLGQDVVDAAEADVIGPAVAADGPDGLLGQIRLVFQDKFAVRRLFADLQRGDERIGHRAGLFLIVPAGQVGVDRISRRTGALHVQDDLGHL